MRSRPGSLPVTLSLNERAILDYVVESLEDALIHTDTSVGGDFECLPEQWEIGLKLLRRRKRVGHEPLRVALPNDSSPFCLRKPVSDFNRKHVRN